MTLTIRTSSVNMAPFSILVTLTSTLIQASSGCRTVGFCNGVWAKDYRQSVTVVKIRILQTGIARFHVPGGRKGPCCPERTRWELAFVEVLRRGGIRVG